jgi:uncharacterized protein YndB with AHSA1/START domain
MSNQKFDWTSFRRKIYIRNSTKEELFKKWTTSEGITEWFIEFAEYTAPDGYKRRPDETVCAKDNYIWIFHNGSKTEGEILEIAENSLFKFTFGENDIGSNEEVIVTVTFHEDKNGAWYDIVQSNMSVSKYSRVYCYISCNMGWAFHMNNMKSIIENGHDLRVKGEKRMNVDAPSGYPLEQYEWTRFRQREYIKAPLKEVFSKWATPGGISDWFLKDVVYTSGNNEVRKNNEIVKKGDNYTWNFDAGLVMKGRVLDIQENSLFKFTFGKNEPGSDEDVIVKVTFKESDGYTIIELEQSNIADNDYGHVTYNLSCMVGWSYYMTNLRSIFESGFDYREKETERAKETTAYNLS